MSFMQFGFVIAGAAAMTLPIWIHLLLRQRARLVPIGSVRFVRNVVRRTKSRQRIQRWLLLAMRALAMLLIGLLFARPFLPDIPTSGRTREVAVLIDRSASMSAMHDDGRTAWEEAVTRARKYVASMGDQAKVHIGLFDATGVESVTLSKLAEAEPAATATRYDDAFAWASDVLASSDRRDKSLLLLSDLQRRGLQQSTMMDDLLDMEVRIEDPAPAVSQNLAIERVSPKQVELRPGMPVAIEIRVWNAGAFPVSRVPIVVELRGPGQTITEELEMSIGAGQIMTSEIELPIDETGIFQGQVRIDRNDPLIRDNQRFVAFEVRHPDRLLLVEGDPGQHSWENASYFLETALRLQTPVGDGPARTFEIEKLIWDQGSGFPDLTGYRMVVLANLGRFRQDDADRMLRFVRNGGNALWFVGDRTSDAVLDPILRTGLLGRTTIGPAIDRLASVSQFDSTHRALQVFENPQYGDLRQLQLRRMMPIRTLDPDSHVLVQSRSSPLVISHSTGQHSTGQPSTGQGNFVLVATSADRSWSDWPQNRLFVPLVRQLASWLTGQLDAIQPVTSELVSDSNQVPGITSTQSSLIVRNLDPVESDLGRLDVEQFRQAAGLAPETSLQGENDRLRELAPAGVARSDEKWPLVVWALLGLLGMELLLATRTHE